MSSNYPPGVTGNERAIAGPSPSEEKQGFIEDWERRVQAIENNLTDLVKEMEVEFSRVDFIDFDKAFDNTFIGLSNIIDELNYQHDQLDPLDEYDDPRL